MSTEALLERARGLNLPAGHYVITGSGPLGVRGIREINDVDIQVDDELWSRLEMEYGPSDDGRTLVLAEGVDAHRDSAYDPMPGVPGLAEQIRDADVFDGLSFVNLTHTKSLKRAKGRRKDLDDIDRIAQWEARHSSS